MALLRRAPLAVEVLMRVVGEPLYPVDSRQHMAQLLRSAGFEIRSDTDTHDWANRLAPDEPRPLLAFERLVVAGRA